MRKDTLGIILTIVGAAIGFLGAFTAASDADNVKLFTLLVVLLVDDVEDLRLFVILIMFMMTSDTGWYLVYAGLGCALLGGIIAAVD